MKASLSFALSLLFLCSGSKEEWEKGGREKIMEEGTRLFKDHVNTGKGTADGGKGREGSTGDLEKRRGGK